MSIEGDRYESGGEVGGYSCGGVNHTGTSAIWTRACSPNADLSLIERYDDTKTPDGPMARPVASAKRVSTS